MMADGEFKTLVKSLLMLKIIDWTYTGAGLYQGWGYEANPLYGWLTWENFFLGVLVQGAFLLGMIWVLWRNRNKPFVQRFLLMLNGAMIGALWAMLIFALEG